MKSGLSFAVDNPLFWIPWLLLVFVFGITACQNCLLKDVTFHSGKKPFTIHLPVDWEYGIQSVYFEMITMFTPDGMRPEILVFSISVTALDGTGS